MKNKDIENLKKIMIIITAIIAGLLIFTFLDFSFHFSLTSWFFNIFFPCREINFYLNSFPCEWQKPLYFNLVLLAIAFLFLIILLLCFIIFFKNKKK